MMGQGTQYRRSKSLWTWLQKCLTLVYGNIVLTNGNKSALNGRLA